jgi:rSAM/selenodomain-associated transferase 1
MTKNLIVFIKNPKKGFVKTRLAKTVGDEKALNVYMQLMDKCRLETSQVEANRFLFYSNNISANDNWPESDFIKKLQYQGDLGERIIHAMQEVNDNSNGPILIIGSDCYDLTAQIIEQAFQELQHKDLVLGPANDGGYYLLGLNKPESDLFIGIDWSTELVEEQTLRIANRKKMTYSILEELIDLDTFEDLEKSGFPNT